MSSQAGKPGSGAITQAHPASDGLAGFLAWWSNRGWLFGLLLVLATVLVYQPAWRGGFLWDDDMHIRQNRMLVEPGGLKQIWSSPDALQYYPLVFTSFCFERALWGLHPAGYHWVNLLLHAASAVLVWRVLRRLNVPGAWLAGAVFALHPVNVESVAWISQRKNTFSMFFYLLSLLLYLRFDQQSKVQSPKSKAGSQQSKVQSLKSKVESPEAEVRSQNQASSDTHHAPRSMLHVLHDPPPSLLYALSLFAFVLALLSKTAVSPLPLVLLGLAWWQRGRVTGRDVGRSTPFFAASLVLGLVTVWFEHQRIVSLVVRDDSLWSRLAGAGWAVWFYLYKALLPLNLMFVYPRWQINPAQALSYVPGLLAVCALLLLWWQRRRWGRAWLFCAGYYVVLLLPVLGFVNIGFMQYSLVADHWQYFSIIGPIALVSAGVAMAMGIRSPKSKVQSPKSPSPRFSPQQIGRGLLGVTLCGAMLVGLGGLTWRQSALYARAETLWQGTLAANPGCWLAHYQLANLLVSQPGAAGPDDASPHNDGNSLRQKERAEEAIAHLQSALRLKPDYLDARINLGNAFLQNGRVDDAITQYQYALQIRPDSEAAHCDLGNALLRKGKADEAFAHFQRALQIKPDDAPAYVDIGNLLLQSGRVDEAITCFQRALAGQPYYAAAHYNLGNALRQQGRIDEAITHYQSALQLSPDYADAHINLGTALGQKGRAAEAIAHFQTALQLDPADPKAQNNLAWVLATCPDASLRNGNQAVQLARHANELAGGKNPVILHTLAAALAETGRFRDAAQNAQKAIELAQAAGQPDLVRQLNDELKRYEAGLPLHQ